ncbi:MAG: hypothetical protein KZQ88_13615 [Candidatus Thiodiazotropha sp. (ex Dulcina madagascariensis)]|nr:hypothetical protein [Candidatus Thiodiazotropha sp. (ex Epidulcina cf. delphinae)]MCU7923725.1 hypothetical protein [Candidatus Thiodiazotropha sp. (ex Dulcina madagascariensis)]MCU7926463.1 hypothetical protein [Candidatus Thiodiazotropha sp. (ex Dulcina madagascariensis)]
MIILTAANKDISKDDRGKVYKNFSFRRVIENTINQATKFGYKPVVYDLGTLGIGRPFSVTDENFSTKGYYSNEPIKGYKSKSLFKPEMVKDSMLQDRELTVYLDGDATLNDSIDEIESDDYDLGVTLRKKSEMEGEWYEEHKDIVRYVNAGVIFFNPTDATFDFLDKWIEVTDKLGNDQMALNSLVCPNELPEEYSVIDRGGVRIKFFPGEIYNYYYFDEGFNGNIKIFHFKGPVRKYFPFTKSKRFVCEYILPVRNRLVRLIKH